jgi:hypothetical protein
MQTTSVTYSCVQQTKQEEDGRVWSSIHAACALASDEAPVSDSVSPPIASPIRPLAVAATDTASGAGTGRRPQVREAPNPSILTRVFFGAERAGFRPQRRLR